MATSSLNETNETTVHAVAHGGANAAIPWQPKKRVLIDGIKLLDDRIDGIHRYVRELLVAMSDAVQTQRLPWQIDVSLGRAGVWPLEEIALETDVEGILNKRIPTLLLNNRRNPLVRSRQRLRNRSKRNIGGYLKETARYRTLKISRGVVSRVHKTKQSLHHLGRRYDLIHLTLPNTAGFYRRYRSPLLMTVHDLSHLVCRLLLDVANVESLAEGLDLAQQRDASFVSVSHATKQQMVEMLGVSEARIDVVHNSVKHDTFRPTAESHQHQEIRNQYGIPNGKFLLCLGTIEPRKNLRNIIQAFRLLLKEHPDTDVHLVLAGGMGWENEQEMKEAILACPKIKYIGYVDDQDLPALYSAATALCYVSRYEGFGLPILESMACGTPVIYGDNSSMPEIAEGTGLPAVATCTTSIQQAMHRIVTNDELRDHLASQALQKANTMTWTQAAHRTLWSYQKAMGLLPAADGLRLFDPDQLAPEQLGTRTASKESITPENHESPRAAA